MSVLVLESAFDSDRRRQRYAYKQGPCWRNNKALSLSLFFEFRLFTALLATRPADCGFEVWLSMN